MGYLKVLNKCKTKISPSEDYNNRLSLIISSFFTTIFPIHALLRKSKKRLSQMPLVIFRKFFENKSVSFVLVPYMISFSDCVLRLRVGNTLITNLVNNLVKSSFLESHALFEVFIGILINITNKKFCFIFSNLDSIVGNSKVELVVIIRFLNNDDNKNYCEKIFAHIRNINLDTSKKLILLCDTMSDNRVFKCIIEKMDLEVSLPKKYF